MISLIDRYRGALLGLACGDAVGTSVEFRTRRSFPRVTDMVGGGPFQLEPGQWTDDTSMALCLAESLVTKGTFDATDQMTRYVNWWHWGYLSSTGECFDIGNTVRGALEAANLGEDADTTAAIVAQIAGAHYGVEAIPRKWRDRLSRREEIEGLAESLCRMADSGR